MRSLVLTAALVLFSAPIGLPCVQADPQSANREPSLDETVDYVNSRFVDSDRS
jgi:hypothetical protein